MRPGPRLEVGLFSSLTRCLTLACHLPRKGSRELRERKKHTRDEIRSEGFDSFSSPRNANASPCVSLFRGQKKGVAVLHAMLPPRPSPFPFRLRSPLLPIAGSHRLTFGDRVDDPSAFEVLSEGVLLRFHAERVRVKNVARETKPHKSKPPAPCRVAARPPEPGRRRAMATGPNLGRKPFLPPRHRLGFERRGPLP